MPSSKPFKRSDKLTQTKGRKSGSKRFAAIPDALLRCEAVRTLTPAVHKILVVMAARFNGSNNGALTLSRATAKEYGMTSNQTLDRGLGILQERGLILMTFPGSYQPPLPARYAIAWRPYDDTEYSRKGMIPNDYLRWSEKGQKKIDHAARLSGPTGPDHRAQEAA